MTGIQLVVRHPPGAEVEESDYRGEGLTVDTDSCGALRIYTPNGGTVALVAIIAPGQWVSVHFELELDEKQTGEKKQDPG